MGESTERLKDSISATQRELSDNLSALEQKASDLKDWRMQYRAHPLVLIGGAFFGAMAIGLLTRRSRVQQPYALLDEQFDTRGRDAGFRGPSKLSGTTDRVKREAGQTWEHITDALLGVAAARAVDFIARAVPGFGDEFSRRHPAQEHGSYTRH